jgi:hypothetical protein
MRTQDDEFPMNSNLFSAATVSANSRFYAPNSVPLADSNSLDESNAWLGSPFSIHVNSHFWKLHGWIDDQTYAWEDTRREEADLSDGWEGPLDSVTDEPHSAGPHLFKVLRFEERTQV